jgi:hypothetical protein
MKRNFYLSEYEADAPYDRPGNYGVSALDTGFRWFPIPSEPTRRLTKDVLWAIADERESRI